jgi:hypothetical protein
MILIRLLHMAMAQEEPTGGAQSFAASRLRATVAHSFPALRARFGYEHGLLKPCKHKVSGKVTKGVWYLVQGWKTIRDASRDA